MNRVSRDEMYMQIAEIVSKRGTCPHLSVGAIIVRNNCIVSEGYNGTPSGMKHCTEGGCKTDENGSCIGTAHAEINAIVKAAKHGHKVDGGTLYTTHSPCLNCAKAIINAGIKRVVYGIPYRNTDGIQLLKEAGILIEQMC